MRLGYGDVMEEETLEIKPTSTPEFNSGGFGTNPTVGGSKVVQGSVISFGTNSIIPSVNNASSDDSVIGGVYIYPIVVRCVKISIYRNIMNRRVLTLYQMQTTNNPPFLLMNI